jgi:hypothetical protein
MAMHFGTDKKFYYQTVKESESKFETVADGSDLNVHRLGDSACGDNITRKIPFSYRNFGQDVVTLSVLMRNNS